jgi:hypothetical protein
MSVLDRWLAWLRSVVGIVEKPKGSNRTPIGEEYGWDGVAWCCITQSVASLHATGEYVLHTAGVSDAMGRAQSGQNGMEWLNRHATIQVGDLPCYDFGPIHGRHGQPADFHIEGVINPGTQTKFETIGGNVSDSVRQQWRDRTYVMGFIRMPYGGSTPDPTPSEEDDFMAALTEAEQRALAVRVEAIQQQVDRIEHSLKTLLGPDEDGTDERVALFDPTNGLYHKVDVVQEQLVVIGTLMHALAEQAGIPSAPKKATGAAKKAAAAADKASTADSP